jgi:2-methylcitrate dehydratase PrpD
VEVMVPSIVFDNYADNVVQNEIDVQFCLQYQLGIAACGFTPGPDWLKRKGWEDPRVREFAKKVKVIRDTAADDVINEQQQRDGVFTITPAALSMQTKGRTYKVKADYSKGDPMPEKYRMTDGDLQNKFRNNCRESLPEDKIDKAINAVYGLEDLASLDNLVERLAV